ncbi:MAG: hypothetical protein HFJ52_08795 [Clostridia bacterium]|nr:hypothetical protein [Clostridia bacterium]
MKNGFSFELYETEFTNCFTYSSYYPNGDLQLSLFGTNPKLNQTSHFADVTLEQNQIQLRENEIVVDCKFKPNLIPQLKGLGILQEQVGICAIGNMIYPIYKIDLNVISQKQYCMQAVAA